MMGEERDRGEGCSLLPSVLRRRGCKDSGELAVEGTRSPQSTGRVEKSRS